jgi:hypothetical protein
MRRALTTTAAAAFSLMALAAPAAAHVKQVNPPRASPGGLPGEALVHPQSMT